MPRRSRRVSVNTETFEVTLHCLRCGRPETRTCTARASRRYGFVGHFTRCERCQKADRQADRLAARRARNTDQAYVIEATRRILEARESYGRRAMAAAADIERPVQRSRGKRCFFCGQLGISEAESRTARFPYCRAHKVTAESKAAGLRSLGR